MIGVKQIPIDSDTRKFIFAGAITNFAQIMSADHIVKGFKANAIWNYTTCIYPIIGGTAFAHKYNLKNQRDSDLANRLTFSGAWVHSGRGMLPDGLTTKADTYFSPSTSAVNNILSLSYYSRTNNALASNEIGSYNFDGDKRVQILVKYSDNNSYGLIYQLGTLASVAVADSLGLFRAARISTSSLILYKKGAAIASNLTLGTTNLPTPTIYIGALNEGAITTFYSTKQCAFASIEGGGISSDKEFIFNQIIQMAQTINFGRQV